MDLKRARFESAGGVLAVISLTTDLGVYIVGIKELEKVDVDVPILIPQNLSSIELSPQRDPTLTMVFVVRNIEFIHRSDNGQGIQSQHESPAQ